MVLGGVVLGVATGWLHRVLYRASHWVIAGDPNGWLERQIRGGVEHLSGGTKVVMSALLIGQGIVKLLLVGSLLRRLHWAFHAAVVLLWAFVVAALGRFAITHGVWLLVTAALDAVIAILVRLEYIRRGADGPAAQARAEKQRGRR